ncbi:hypothetical protein QLX55_03755 [Solobacterium moorei]|uniref:hypothetical protein n=1 Tax=Solobacterium moorei TaxID=102148 RepID=UPI0024AD59E2|nr:hypothetical protein [Solobacterium moorei]MCI5722407.1 hypothetical protein [Erysipelotrichaceae bacterium]MDI6414448.1 hypothetical protein [Solobacterium moorei]
MEKLPSYIIGIIVWSFIIYFAYKYYTDPMRKYKKEAKIAFKREEKLKKLELRKIKAQAMAQAVVERKVKGHSDANFVKHAISSAHQGENVARCPKCGSVSISGNKKGFGIGKAVVGAAALGPIGLVAGNAGAKKIRCTCLNCGHQWWAGQK